jgi:DNA-binding NtrC family response regulator
LAHPASVDHAGIYTPVRPSNWIEALVWEGQVMRARHVLLVDDDPAFTDIIEFWLKGAGCSVTTLHDEIGLDRALTRGPSLCLLDLDLGRSDGLSVLSSLRRTVPSLPVVMLTRDGSVSAVVEAMRRGAFEYLVKPIDRQALLTLVERVTVDVVPRTGPAALLLGDSKAMGALRERVAAVARRDVTVLVLGETGTGKELVARAIHAASARSTGPFVALSCAAVPESLQDSELFGHERGAFTGAHARRAGRFEQANGGTLFLDEVGELSPSMQSKLLRVLQERTFNRVGGSSEIPTDIRVVAATHRDLREEVRLGRFRADLFFRLSVFEVTLPPLRERGGDIGLLARHFAAALGQGPVVLSEEALDQLARYPWPGNVRELRSAIEHALVLASEGRIDVAHLPASISVGAPPPPEESAPASSAREAVAQVERALLVRALADANGNASAAMRQIGMPRSTFYRRLKEYGLL